MAYEHERPTSLAVSPSETLIASGHHDGKVRVWNLSGQQIYEGTPEAPVGPRSPAPVESLAFAPDESVRAAGTRDGEILRVELPR